MSTPKPKHSPIVPVSSELQALIAAAAMPSAGGTARTSTASTSHPARSLPDLAQATHAVSRWYVRELGDRPEFAIGSSGSAMNLDDVVRQHIAVRQDWEHREAVNLAAWLTQAASSAPRVEASAPFPTAAVPTTDRRRRALLIDDSSDILVTVGAFLEAFGFAVTVAASSEAALQILAKTSVDLLITDHAMPGMTGKDLAIEALQQNPALRIIIITGYPDLQELKALPPSVMVLAKPFRRAELFGYLRTVFECPDQDTTVEAFAGESCVPRD